MTVEYVNIENFAEELKERFLSKLTRQLPEENTGYKVIIHNFNVILYFPKNKEID